MKKTNRKKRETREERAVREAQLLNDLGLELTLNETIRININVLLIKKNCSISDIQRYVPWAYSHTHALIYGEVDFKVKEVEFFANFFGVSPYTLMVPQVVPDPLYAEVVDYFVKVKLKPDDAIEALHLTVETVNLGRKGSRS